MKCSFTDPNGMPGGFLAVSSNGSAAGSGIVWANVPYSGDANHSTVPGILRAFDANNLSTELWNSRTNSTRDNFGNFAKFVPPVVTNGKVYMATFSNQVAVYGLLSGATTGISESLSPSALTLKPGASGSVIASVSSFGSLPGPISLSATGAPAGVTVSFNPASITGSGSSTVSVSTTSSVATGTYFLTITAASGAYSASQQLSLTVSNTLVSVNAGGGAVGAFSGDTNYSGGNVASTTHTIDLSGVTNPAPQAVYQSERYGGVTYTFSGLTAGATYTVRLHFAEFYWTTTGKRVFNVSINGTTVLSNFDIVAAAGAANKAIVKQFSGPANSSGQIAVQFINGSIDHPKISGIEVQ
jgi:hypothetical protein